MATTPKTMCTNIGGMERMLRVIAGIAILYMGPGLGLRHVVSDWYYSYTNRYNRMVPFIYSFWDKYIQKPINKKL